MIPIEKWEQAARKDLMIPEHRESYKGMDIYVALSPEPRDPDEFHDKRYYKASWAVGKHGTMDIGSILAIDVNHDLSMEISSRKRSRVNSAIKAAKDYIDDSIGVGLHGNH